MRWLTLGVVVALVAACGGGGDAGPAPPTAPSKAFVADRGQSAIGSSSNSNPGPGTLVVDRTIVGANTMLSPNLIDLALDAANDRLYVADLRSILVFNNASTASGNVAPSRVVSSFTGAGNFAGIYLDTVNDRLYATVNLGVLANEVRVFDNVSTLSNATPTRTFTFSSSSLIDIAVDTTKNIAYVFNLDPATNFTRISVFAGAAALTGTVTPTRTISLGDLFSSGAAIGMFIDPANDRLYAPRSNGRVVVFDNASVITTTLPARTITLPVPAYTNIFVELTANRLYAADNAGVNIIENASTASGIPVVTRALAPGGSVFMAVVVKP